MIALVLLGLLLFRPHGDTFTALDHSGYRMMGYAFAQGRGFHEADRVMLEAPQNVRQALMLLPHMNERNTRDRSFLIAHLDDPVSQPFFYPLLPLMAAQLESIFPGWGLDMMVPLLGLVFCIAVLLAGLHAGGIWGIGVAVALILGSPLPVWLFRGFYVEACGAACLAVAIVIYLHGSAKVWVGILAGLMAGLAVSFHPVYIVAALPLVGLIALDPLRSRLASLGVLAGFAAGFSLLLAMTEWICQPYGDFSVSSVLSNYRVSASHRIPVLFAGGSLLLMAVGLLSKPWWSSWLSRVYERLWFRVGLLIVAGLPLFYAASIWQYDQLVRHGLMEGWQAIRIPLGLLVVAGVLGVCFSKHQSRAFGVLLIFILTLPAFAYLKGAEQMGMWSQRRLLPAYTLLVLAVLPGLSGWIREFIQRIGTRWRVAVSIIILSGLAIAGLANMVRWPAPYFTRVERQGLSFVQEVKDVIGDRLVLFDYHPFSFPFAVDNRTRAAGIGQGSLRRMDRVASWLAEMAATEDVWWASVYANPGLEDGVVLELVSMHTARLQRVVSRGALPAEERAFEIELALLRARRLESSEPDGLVLDKVLDGGPLALREPWGHYRRSLTDEAGNRVPADWSREGSGVVGPVPPPGDSARVVIQGQSGRAADEDLLLRVPWDDQDHVLSVSSAYGAHEIIIPRPESTSEQEIGLTGVYRLYSASPYDPAQEGIRGFAHDLGVLIHRIRIETIAGQ